MIPLNRTTLRTSYFALCTFCCLPIAALAALSADMNTHLATAFDTLGNGTNVDVANTVVPLLSDAQISDADWQTLFRKHFETHAFSPALTQFWQYAMQQAGTSAPRCALISGFCAWEALRAGLASAASADAVDLSSALNAAGWLSQAMPYLGKDGPGTLLKSMTESLKGRGLDLARFLGAGTQTRAGMQVCLTLADYANQDPKGRSQLGGLLGLSGPMRAFWESTGAFLFDNGALATPQWSNLDMLMRSIPPPLHAIAAWVVPEAVGVDPAQGGLLSTGQIMSLAAIPPDAMTAPSEFLAHVGQPVAPLFTITAAQQIVRAIQVVQFTRRPWLVAQRDRILARAKDRRERYLRRDVLPAVYLEQPDELLPQTAFLWFIDSARAFRMAYQYARVGEREALDAVLLLADVLSNGGNTTLLFTTDPAGQVTSGETPISRISMGDGPSFVNGIRIGDTIWTFGLDATGAVITRVGPDGGSGF